MFTRRNILIGGVAASLFATTEQASAHHTKNYKRAKFRVNRKYLPQRVRYKNSYAPGTIVVDTNKRFLYLIENKHRARRYGVGVGRAGLEFKGGATIQRKAEWPRWTPTANMIRREPQRYLKYAKGLPGGINNPLGARALYLYKNGRDTHFRIHGTTEPWSIGQSMSSGCIRLINAHVEDLYERVAIGTKVIVV